MKRIIPHEINDRLNQNGLHLSSHIDTFLIPITFSLFDLIFTDLYNELRFHPKLKSI